MRCYTRLVDRHSKSNAGETFMKCRRAENQASFETKSLGDFNIHPNESHHSREIFRIQFFATSLRSGSSHPARPQQTPLNTNWYLRATWNALLNRNDKLHFPHTSAGERLYETPDTREQAGAARACKSIIGGLQDRPSRRIMSLRGCRYGG